MSDEARKLRAKERYETAAHRVQSAIAAHPNPRQCEPKHMRVGVDMSKSDQGGLAKLLLKKGVFSEAEYFEAMADAAEEEAQRYEDELSVLYGANVRTV